MLTTNSRFSYERFAFRATAAVHGDEVLDLTDWVQLSQMDRELPGWDGTVVVAADQDEIRALIKSGDAPKSFMDERVVCGGVPADIPWLLSDMFDEFVDTMSKIFKAPKWVRGQFASTLALAWRAQGYPKVDAAGLLKIAQEHFPALLQVVKAPSGAWWAPNPTIRGLEVYKAQDVDAAEVAELLTRRGGTKTSTSEALKKIRKGMLAIRNFEDKLVAVSVISTGNRVHTRPDNDKILSLVENLVNQSKTGEFELADNYCYTCRKSALSCSCPKTEKAFKDMVKSSLNHRGGEHRWGRVYSSKPTVESIIKAGQGAVDVRAMMVSLHSEQAVQAWEKTLGRAVWFDISVFLQQCQQDTKALKGVSMEIMGELEAAQKRVESIHNYAPTLYDEFEGPQAQLDGKYTEVYLGRDAIFAYFARWAQRATMRAMTPLDERSERFAGLSEIRYTVVSRTAKWINGVHTPKLGSYPAVFIDTGFSGSIPRAIAQEEHLSISDRPGKRSGKVTLVNGTSQVRLMNTGNVGYRFVHQWTHDAVNGIEMDAKPTITAKAVDEAEPTGAMEQLVFRVLRRGIAELSSRKTKELFEKGGGPKRILTYEDAKAYIAEKKAVQA